MNGIVRRMQLSKAGIAPIALIVIVAALTASAFIVYGRFGFGGRLKKFALVAELPIRAELTPEPDASSLQAGKGERVRGAANISKKRKTPVSETVSVRKPERKTPLVSPVSRVLPSVTDGVPGNAALPATSPVPVSTLMPTPIQSPAFTTLPSYTTLAPSPEASPAPILTPTTTVYPPPSQESGDQTSSVDHVLIAEIAVDMEGADRTEFVELYNPTDAEIDISSWSLQYISGGADSIEKVRKKNFIAGAAVAPRGFYLVGMGNYAGGVPADMTWSQSLNNVGATVFLVSNQKPISSIHDEDMVDRIAYGTGSGLLVPEGNAAELPLADETLERRALSNGTCVAATDSGEFSGNGCDTNNNMSDFETRSTPYPQNAFSPREP